MATLTHLSPPVRSLLDLLFPPFCLICDRRLSTGEKLVCENCWAGLPRVGTSRTVPPVFVQQTHTVDGFASVWRYCEEIQKIIFELKYYRKRSLARRIGGEMARLLRSDDALSAADLLVPVPLHSVKLRERGYNQSALLAQAISQQTGIPVRRDVLKRIRYTATQSKLHAEQRLTNVVDAFAARAPLSVQGKACLLIDDILTTGATLYACGRQLREAGASQIFVLTAAQAL